MMLWAFVPYALGWHTTLVTSGSMEPAVRTGDLVVVAPMDPAMARDGEIGGAVVQFDDPVHPGRLMLHRVIGRENDASLITKGDNNPTRDYATAPPETVHGLARLRIPFAGLPMLWLRTGQTVPLGALGLVILFLAWPERRVTRQASTKSTDEDIPVGI
jgi:signal peptidase I